MLFDRTILIEGSNEKADSLRALQEDTKNITRAVDIFALEMKTLMIDKAFVGWAGWDKLDVEDESVFGIVERLLEIVHDIQHNPDDLSVNDYHNAANYLMMLCIKSRQEHVKELLSKPARVMSGELKELYKQQLNENYGKVGKN